MMSWQASQWTIKQRAGSTAGKAILFVLGEASDGTGLCWLSQTEIALRAEVSKRTVVDQLAAHERAGLLTRHARLRSDGSRSSDLIQLALPRLAGGEVIAPGGEMAAPPPGEMAAPGGEAAAHLTTFEPVNEPVFSLVVAPPNKTASRKQPQVDLPAAFPGSTELHAASKAYAAAGLPFDPASEAQRFRDHHEAKGNRMSSWPAAWRTWTANGLKYAAERQARTPSHFPSTSRSPLDLVLESYR